MAKIFISYSRDSQDIVEELVQDLNDDDHETWFDQRLTGGQKWWDSILSEIRQSDIFVAALTPDSLESQACLRELNYAQRLQKPVLPMRLSDKVQPEALAHGLAELQNLVYRPQDKAAFKVLQKTIRKLPKTPALPDPLPDPPAVPRSYLSTLRERIETDSPLEYKDQAQLVFELRIHFQDGGPAAEIIDLLQRLKRRRELLAYVQRGIDELLVDINRVQQGSPSSRASIDSNDTPEEGRKGRVPTAKSDSGTDPVADIFVADDDPTMQRLEDQIAWYDSRSLQNQRIFKVLKLVTILAAALIVLLVGENAPRWIIGGLGFLIVVIEGLQLMNQYHPNWITYRSTCEALKHEKFRYLAKAGPYAAAADARVLLAERIEALVSQEHAKWASGQEYTERSKKSDE